MCLFKGLEKNLYVARTTYAIQVRKYYTTCKPKCTEFTYSLTKHKDIDSDPGQGECCSQKAVSEINGRLGNTVGAQVRLWFPLMLQTNQLY